jgi:hypothetical protein
MKQLGLLLFCIIVFNALQAQNVPIGDWQAYYSYTSAQHVLNTGKRIFCSTYNGFFSVGLSDKKVIIYSKADGLNDVGISSMAYNADDKTLLTAYRSGNLDLMFLNESSEVLKVTNLPLLIEASDLPADKRINHILFHEKLAYLTSPFGIVVLDTKLNEVKETYRYIGSAGTELNISGIAFTTDSLFAITSQNVIGTSMSSTVNRQYFANWRTVAAPTLPVALVSRNGILYGGFSGQGIFKRTNGKWSLIYPSDSRNYALSVSGNTIIATLEKEIVSLDPADNKVVLKDPLFMSLREAELTGANSLWIADIKNGLISNIENSFRSYSPPRNDTTIVVRPDSSIKDQNGLLWTRLPGYLGGGILVKNPGNGNQRILSTAPGNGNLPSLSINSLAADTDGYIWFASDNGVGYFSPDGVLSAASIDAIFPIYGQRKLFINEKCTALAIEPGNRKWIGTVTGLYLFNADGTELVDHFTTENEPLPSNAITALRFEAETGLLFIDTPNGMVSYRSNSTSASENYSNVTIFPNPVRPGYSGSLGISGLKNNSIVKITSLSGRLIYETRSQGGTASWDLNDYTGRRTAGGIYMIMVISDDKSAKFAGKFAVID